MKKIILPLLLLGFHLAFSQNTGKVNGVIFDEQTNAALPGASVSVKGTNIFTISDDKGKFILRDLIPGKIFLIISHVAYEQMELPVSISDHNNSFVNISLTVGNRIGNEVIISASKRPEKITNAPASIQVIGRKDLEEFPGSNVTELVSKVQGIEYTRSGVDDITFNARGLNSAFNNKVFQMVDGRNTMAAASAGLALFNNGSTIKDDIERIEIVMGPQSALYGPNAHNALFNYITKDPRQYQGTSVSASIGSQSQYSTRFRHALQINNKWAYKLTGEHAIGKDFEWHDSVYAGNQNGNTPFFGSAVAIPERIQDFGFRRSRSEAHVYYTLKPGADIIVSGGGSKFTRTQVTTGTHNRLEDITYGFLQARFVHPHFFANVYNTWGNLGKVLFLGNYTRDFWNRTHSSQTIGPNRYLPPDSAEIFATRLGNYVTEKSQRVNADAQYNYHFEKAGLLMVAGMAFQKDMPNGYGLTLIDSFQKIRTTQYGAVVQLDKSLPLKFRFISTLRLDHHSNFGNFFAPRFGLLKGFGDGNLRITWGKAYAMPSIQNQYAGIGRSLFGNASGIYYIPNGTNIHNTEDYRTTTPLQPEQVQTWEIGYKGNFFRKFYIDVNYYDGLSKNFISPSRSVGGRVISVNGIPVTHNPAIAGSIQNDTLKNASFSTFFNYGDVRTFGIDAGVSYSYNKHINFTVRYSWFGSDITKDNPKNDANKDGYVSAEEKSLNTPQNRAIAIINLQNLFRSKLFVNFSIRYVEQYEFYSGSQIGTVAGKGKRGKIEIPGKPPLIKNFDWGPLGGLKTVDLSAGYKFNAMVSINAGVTNLFNCRQIEMVASPSISRLFMTEIKINVPYLKKQISLQND
jgi:outer membrane receptor for ferrienterochelin and colicins